MQSKKKSIALCNYLEDCEQSGFCLLLSHFILVCVCVCVQECTGYVWVRISFKGFHYLLL